MLAIIFFAGILHGLGPDHLAAITAFGAAVGGSYRRVTFFALRFAASHALVLAVAGILGHFSRYLLPLAWERAFDISAGVLLVLSGTALLLGMLTGRVRVHAHSHDHGLGEHKHFHLHFSPGSRADDHQHTHGRLAWLLGGLFALGGARSLLVVVPITLTETALGSLVRITAFALGIAISMLLYALLADSAFTRLVSAFRPRAVLCVTAAFCVGAGSYTVISRLLE